MEEKIKKETKACQYCAEEILAEAKLCRFCKKTQEPPVRSKQFWLFVWLPTISLLVLGFLFGSLWPIIAGIIYWSALAYKEKK